MYRRSRGSAEIKASDIPQRPQDTLKLTDQYIALLILIFTKAGLLDVSVVAVAGKVCNTDTVPQALTSIFAESSVGSTLSRKATLLMAEVLQKANCVLPLSIAAKIQVCWLDHVSRRMVSYYALHT